MDDPAIIQLYFDRSQAAIKESQKKYGSYCRTISMNILRSREDTEECLSDTWMNAWETIPPERPNCLAAFFGKIIRNISLSLWRKRTAQKRHGNEASVCLDELNECISDGMNGRIAENMELKDALDRFLGSLDQNARVIFMKRYWYVIPVKKIAGELSMNEGAVKMSLLRTRKKLRQFLEEEGIDL